MPTHVHPNFNTLHFADIGDNYVPYNKPGSIKHWCAPPRPTFPSVQAEQPPAQRSLARPCSQPASAPDPNHATLSLRPLRALPPRLENVNVTEEYVFFIDADMLFLE